MTRLASGDNAAIFTLHEYYGHRIVGVIRRQLQHLNYGPIDGEDLATLVLDACIALSEVAGGWRPGAAQPWNWAAHRIAAVVNRWVGNYASSLEGQHDVADETTYAPCVEPDLDQVFARLAQDTPIVSLVRSAAREAKLDEPAFFLLVDYRIHQDQGDPSPAHTLAARHGLTPEAVRQRVSRGRKRLRDVIASDERYAPIADLALVA